jgi:hypothetical protein
VPPAYGARVVLWWWWFLNLFKNIKRILKARQTPPDTQGKQLSNACHHEQAAFGCGFANID